MSFVANQRSLCASINASESSGNSHNKISRVDETKAGHVRTLPILPDDFVPRLFRDAKFCIRKAAGAGGSSGADSNDRARLHYADEPPT